MDALGIGGERRSIEGPTAGIHPGALTEIDVVEATEPAAPGIGVAAEKAQLRGLERRIESADAVALGQRLGRPIDLEAAAFDEAHLQTRRGKIEGKGDSGGARADDAEIAIDDAVRRKTTCVDE
jgi:hypothetical protein